MACGILQDQGSNLHLLHWQVDSLPLSHQGSLKVVLLKTCIQEEESFCNLPEEQQRKNGVWNSRCSRYPTESHVCFVSRSCPTLCDLMNCSPPGSSVHGISQARIPVWVATSYSRGYSWPRNRNCVLHSLLWQADFYQLHHLGSKGGISNVVMEDETSPCGIREHLSQLCLGVKKAKFVPEEAT